MHSARLSRNNKAVTSSKSLHVFKKREEMKRIERENLKIAQKIFAMKPSIRAVDHLKDYDYYKSISKGMRKILKTRVTDVNAVGLLPPIKGAAEMQEDGVSDARKFTLNSGMSSYAPLTERRAADATSTSEASGLTGPMRPIGVDVAPKRGLGGVSPNKHHAQVGMNIVEEAKTAENFNADTREGSPGASRKDDVNAAA